MSNTRLLRIVCNNSGIDNPLAICVVFPHGSDNPGITCYGASARREAELIQRLSRFGPIMTTGSKAEKAEELLVQIRIAVHRVW